MTIEDAWNSAALVAWVTLAGAFVTWLLKTQAQRRVRVRATAGIGWTHDSRTGKPTDHTVNFIAFNNLPVDVGIQSVIVQLKRRENRLYSPLLQEPPPETLKAQHSMRITYAADHLSRLWGDSSKTQEEAEKRRYRIQITLGNGSIASSAWFSLPVEVEMKPPRTETDVADAADS